MQFLQRKQKAVAKTRKYLTGTTHGARIQSIQYAKGKDGDKYRKSSVLESGGTVEAPYKSLWE
jgi:hypothetical protein